jgi:uncharacterized protein YegJ (DUF2314 family)
MGQLLLPAALAVLLSVTQPPPPANVFNVPVEDAEMSAAIREARASLPEFWKALAHPAPGVGDFALKVEIADSSGTEHFWLADITRRGDVISGLIDNEPAQVQTVKMGQRYEFKEDRISDWTFTRNGKMVGNWTARVLVKRMPRDEAERFLRGYEKP